MKQHAVKRFFSRTHAGAALCLCLVLTALFGVLRPLEARADVALESFWYTMYSVDYSALADGPDGKAEFRWGAGTEYSLISEEGVPNGTLLYIEQEARADDGKFWACVSYNGYSGWTPVKQLKKLDKETADKMWETWEETTAAAETDPDTETRLAEETSAAIGTSAVAETSSAVETSAAAETSTAIETSAVDPQALRPAKFKNIFRMIGKFLGL